MGTIKFMRPMGPMQDYPACCMHLHPVGTQLSYNPGTRQCRLCWAHLYAEEAERFAVITGDVLLTSNIIVRAA